MTTADTNAVRAGCRAACIATVAAGLLLLAAASSAAVGERTARIVTSDARPAGVYLMTRGVVGARAGAVRLSPQATGPATLSANGRYLVYEVGGSVRVPTGLVGSSSLRAHDFATGEDAFVVTGGHDPTFRPDGTLVYLQRIIRDGSNVVQYRPMQRRGLLGPVVRLGPLLQPVGELVPAAGGRALVELPTSVSQSHVVILQAGASPRTVALDATQSGVVAASDDGRRALVWALRGHAYALAVVRVADGRVLSEADTGVPESSAGYLPSPTGVWSGGRGVVSFNNRLVVANIRAGVVRVDERLDLPDVSTPQSGGHPIAVIPQWVRFLDSSGGSIVLAADLEPPSLGGGSDINLFTCRLSSARCTRTQIGQASGARGSGMAFRGVAFNSLVAPISRAGSGTLARGVEPRTSSAPPLLAFADSRTGWMASAAGLFVTRQGGSTWTRATVPGVPSQLDVLDVNHAWVVTAGRVYRTEDGARWQREGWLRPLLQLHFLDGTHGYAVTTAGLLLTTADAGAHWTTVDSEGNRFSQVCLTSSGEGLAVERNEVVDTHDGGRSWGVAYTPPTPRRHASHISLGCGGSATFALDSFGERGGHEAYELFASRDGGTHWYTSLQEPYFAQGQFPLYPAVAHPIPVAPQAGLFVAVGGKGLVLAGHCTSCVHERTSILATANGGQSWRSTPRRAFSRPTSNATDLTPGYAAALDNAHPLALSFPDMRNGWLLLRRPDGTDRLAHTADGGASWRTEALPPGA